MLATKIEAFIMDYLSNEDGERLKRILQQNETEMKIDFQESVARLVNLHTHGKEYSFRTIMDKAHLRSDIGFPVENPTYLPKICNSFQIPVATAIELYHLAGRTLHTEYDCIYIDTQNISSHEPFLCKESYLDCLLQLIKEHDYISAYPNPTPSVENLIDFAKSLVSFDINALSIEKKKQKLFTLSKIIHEIGLENNWVIAKIDNAFFAQQKHIRETVFEIAFACDFNISETQRLYRSFGLFMNKDKIKFDAFISFLLSLQFGIDMEHHSVTQNKKMYIYKDVCSTLPYVENSNDFHRKNPDYQSLEKVLDNNEPYTLEELMDMLF